MEMNLLGFFKLYIQKYNNSLGLQVQSPVLGSFWTGIKVGMSLLLPLLLTAVQTPAQNCPFAFYWDQRTLLEDELLHQGDRPSCWKSSGSVSTGRGQGSHAAPEAVLWAEMCISCISISPKVSIVQRLFFPSLPGKSELLPNDEEALVERNRSKVKHWWENSLGKKWAFLGTETLR